MTPGSEISRIDGCVGYHRIAGERISDVQGEIVVIVSENKRFTIVDLSDILSA